MAKGKFAAFVGLGAAASAVGGTYKFAEFMTKAKRIKDVQRANATYVRSIQRVRRDLDEVKRLLSVPEIKDLLSANRPKAEWVLRAVKDTRIALEAIAPYVERVASDVEDGSIGVRHRVKWLLSEHEKLENREKELAHVHTSLAEVLGYLTGLEPAQAQRKETTHVDTRVNIDIEKDGRQQYVERDVYVEQERAPARVEERETYIEHHGPRRVEERETYIERRPRVEEQYYDAPPRRYEEREVHIHRDPRRVEAEYYERRPAQYDERRYEERRYEGSRVVGPDEDREPDYDNFQHGAPSTVYRSQVQYEQDPRNYEYFERRRVGDPGFGDQEIINPQPVPPVNRGYASREVSRKAAI